jgi:hypothetical protein
MVAYPNLRLKHLGSMLSMSYKSMNISNLSSACPSWRSPMCFSGVGPSLVPRQGPFELLVGCFKTSKLLSLIPTLRSHLPLAFTVQSLAK